MELKKAIEYFRRFKVLVKTYGPTDIRILQKWLEGRNSDVDVNQETLGYGYVVYSLVSGPVAIGFVRDIGSCGFIEGVTTNPDTSSSERNEAIDTLVSHLLGYARRQGIKKVIGYSLDENIVKRAERHGFIKQPHVMFSIDLGGEYGFC